MNKLKQKTRVILAGKPFISIRSLKNNFEKGVVDFFVNNANELGYYFCPECNYYVKDKFYNHQMDMCNQCYEKKGEHYV